MIYLKQIDGLRCLAIGLVLTAHWRIGLQATLALPFGAMGVDLFFVISGFLITQILLNSKQHDESKKQTHRMSLRQFYLRRILRIFPIYYLTIFIFFAANFSYTREIIWWLLTYTLNIGTCLNANTGIFGHFWSLAVEEQFYLLFPVFIFMTPQKHLLKGLITVVLLAVLSRIVIVCYLGDEKIATVVIYHFTICCFDSLGIGALLAWLYINKYEQLKSFLGKYGVLFIISFLFFVIFEQILMRGFGNHILRMSLHIMERFIYSAACFGVVAKIAVGGFRGITKLVLENRIVVFIGKISYGIYVYHNFMPALFPKELQITSSVAFFAATFILAVTSWYLIEKPINNLKRYFEYY